METPEKSGNGGSQSPKLPKDWEIKLKEAIRQSERPKGRYFLGMKSSSLSVIALVFGIIALVMFIYDASTSFSNPHLPFLYLFFSASALVMWLEDRKRFKDD